ncbi:MAG: hypothetical protein Q8S32_00945 [Burkholderiaceae bacterium]|nr:hypothetical protein [Burkholderiaceae bacterium]
MAEQTFNKAVGEVIALRFIGDWATSDDDGIRIKPDIESGDCTQILSWTPACEMEGWPDAPDALTHPSLPYPFNAKELAAFLLAGVGAFVGEYYGDFSDGPDEDGLRALGIKAGHAREALRQAYAEIRRAIEQVGEIDQQLQQKASHLRSQFADANDEANTREGIWEPGISDEEYRVRRARASQSVKELEVEMESVGRSADSALKHWNASMVKALLYPTHELTDSAAPPEAVLMPAQAPAMTKAGPPHEVGHQNQPATTVPVVAASDEKPWLSIDPQDPAPAQPWYTPARYFARQLTIEKPALLANRALLAHKVSTALFNAGFKKRGGKERFDSGTVLKAFANVSLG